MDIILLERIAKLGHVGETVTVKDGFARNFLLPQGKALRATKANLARFEAERATLEARDQERKAEAAALAEKLNGTSYVMIRSAGETGQLYGSVAARDVVAALAEAGFSVARNQVELSNPIKAIGIHQVAISLHPEVDASVDVNVARSEDEAERQAKGEDLSMRDYADEDEDALSLEEVFENPEDAELELDSDDAAEEASEDVAAEAEEAAKEEAKS